MKVNVLNKTLRRLQVGENSINFAAKSNNGCEVIVINGVDVSSEKELAADMVSLLVSFSGKFCGRR